MDDFLDRLLKETVGIMREVNTDKPFLLWLEEDCKYLAPEEVVPGKWVAVERLIFHWSLIGGNMGDYIGHDFRYCYRTLTGAAQALTEWEERGWVGEPTGWHKRRSLPARIVRQTTSHT